MISRGWARDCHRNQMSKFLVLILNKLVFLYRKAGDKAGKQPGVRVPISCQLEVALLQIAGDR